MRRFVKSFTKKSSTTTIDEGPTTRSRAQATTEEGPTTRARKSVARERGKQKRGESSRQREDSGLQPENFGFELADDDDDYAHFRVLCELPYKQCRFQDMEAMTRMGIADNVLTMANNVGLAPLFQANHLAYRALTLEFMSTVVVDRSNRVPREMRFQLGNQWHVMHVNVLDQILQCPPHGAYTGNHDINPHELWG